MAAYFSKTLFLHNLKRFWLIAVAVFFVAFFSFIVPEFALRPHHAQQSILELLAPYSTIHVSIFSVITAIAMFGYLHRPKSAGFISSLPISRLGLYVTNWISGLTIMLGPMVLISTIYGIVLTGSPTQSDQFPIWIGMMIFAHLFFYSLAVFVVFLTGKPVMQVFLFAFMSAISLLVIVMGFFVADMFVFGYTDTSLDMPIYVVLLTPHFAIGALITNLNSPGDSISLLSILTLAIYPIFTALMIFFGYRLYRRRRTESAGDVIVHKGVRSTFKYLIGLLLGAILGFTLTEVLHNGSGLSFSMNVYVFSLTLSVVMFGSLGCLFTEMLIQKRLRVWKTAYKSMLFFSAGIVAIALFIRLDVVGYERRVPNPDDVVAVSFSTDRQRGSDVLFRDLSNPETTISSSGRGWELRLESYGYCCEKCFPLFLPPTWCENIIDEIRLRSFDYFESPEAILAATELHRAIIRDRRHLEMYSLGRRNQLHTNTFFLRYKMNDGRIITRQYIVPISENTPPPSVEYIFALYGQAEALEKRNRFANMPDDAIIWMGAQRYARYEQAPPLRSSRNAVRSPRLISDDNQAVILEALRQDIAAGTLGYLDVFTNYSFLYNRSQTLSENPETVILQLMYDPELVSIPAIFRENRMRCDVLDKHVQGFLQNIIVNAYNVNTMRVLRELGII